MSLILRQMRWYQQGKDSVATGTADPALKNKLTETEKNLNSILNKWTWDGAKPKSAQEFLNKFSPWVDEHIKQGKDLKVFLSKWSSTSLNQLETTWNNTEKDYQEQIKELQNKGATELSEELKTKLENYDNLETDLDQAKRDKYTIEQDNIALTNRLKNKQNEINEKDKEITKLKKEFQEKDKSLNDKIKDLKKKYDKKSQLLDQEQTAMAKLEEKITNLETENTQLNEQCRKLILELSGGETE